MFEGCKLDRLRKIASRHQHTLAESETIALTPLIFDDDINDVETRAFIGFRAAAQLASYCNATGRSFDCIVEQMRPIMAELRL